MIEHFEVYCDGKIVYKVEGKREPPFPFNMALDAAMTHLKGKISGVPAMILDEQHVLLGVVTIGSYHPCPWTFEKEIDGA